MFNEHYFQKRMGRNDVRTEEKSRNQIFWVLENSYFCSTGGSLTECLSHSLLLFLEASGPLASWQAGEGGGAGGVSELAHSRQLVTHPRRVPLEGLHFSSCSITEAESMELSPRFWEWPPPLKGSLE